MNTRAMNTRATKPTSRLPANTGRGHGARRQAGFTLVEILVGLTIGLFLTAGMVQMYVANNHTIRFTDRHSRMQEAARFALAQIAEDMRMADFWGCSRGNEITVNLNDWCTVDPVTGAIDDPDAPADTTTATFIQGTDGGDGGDGAPNLPDTITLRGAVGMGLIVDASSTTNDLDVVGKVGDAREVIEEEDIALVTSCEGGDLFQITSLGGGSPTDVGNAKDGDHDPGNATDALSMNYDQSATLYRWREVRYWIEPGVNGTNALHFQEDACTGGEQRELVEGVMNMQIAYGEDTDDDGMANRYVSATVLDTPARWNRVVSVRIGLLMATVEDDPLADGGLVDQPQQFTFDNYDGDSTNDTFTAGDRRFHQVVTATFAIRNAPL